MRRARNKLVGGLVLLGVIFLTGGYRGTRYGEHPVLAYGFLGAAAVVYVVTTLYWRRTADGQADAS